MDIPLPFSKLALDLIDHDDKTNVVLVATASFNPPTFMHLCLLLARDALNSEGLCVIGGYMSPVYDAYNKRGLISSEHPIKLGQLACKSSDFMIVDPWEVIYTLSLHFKLETIFLKFLDVTSFFLQEKNFSALLTVLSRVKSFLCEWIVVIVCGYDVLQSFAIPGFWIPEQDTTYYEASSFFLVQTICSEFGVVCICREGQDVEKIVSDDEVLNKNRLTRCLNRFLHYKIVDELVPNQISSTRVRDCISKGLSIKYLTADEVVNYITENQLYFNEKLWQTPILNQYINKIYFMLLLLII
ncbi:hypothetical protein UlMin_028198 [Ulmus minor]